MSEIVRVYVNGRPIDVPQGATALDAAEAADTGIGLAIRAGDRLITDSRGIVTPTDAPVQNGAIFRIVRARQVAEDNDPSLL
jgi:hypothetical protein